MYRLVKRKLEVKAKKVSNRDNEKKSKIINKEYIMDKDTKIRLISQPKVDYVDPMFVR